MKIFEPLVVGIDGVMRTHPLPNLPNFKVVPWEDQESLSQADIFVQANIAENKLVHLYNKYDYIRKSGKPWIVAESPVFRKNCPKKSDAPKAYHRYSWFSYFRDEGIYNNKNCSSDRWTQIQRDQNIEIKDWKKSGDYILLILQRPGDSSLKNLISKFGDYSNFLKQTLLEIKRNSTRPIKVRLHPLRREKQLEVLNSLDIKNLHISKNMQGTTRLEGGDGLEKDLENAWCSIGFNSNALTESICEGVPTFSLCPSSMAWECSNTTLSRIESPQFFDREQWLNNLAYCQWRTDEIKEGLPFWHLMKVYNTDYFKKMHKRAMRSE